MYEMVSWMTIFKRFRSYGGMNDDNEYLIIKRLPALKQSSFGWHFAIIIQKNNNNFPMRSSFKPLIKYIFLKYLNVCVRIVSALGWLLFTYLRMCHLHAFSIQLARLKPLHKLLLCYKQIHHTHTHIY